MFQINVVAITCTKSYYAFLFLEKEQLMILQFILKMIVYSDIETSELDSEFYRKYLNLLSTNLAKKQEKRKALYETSKGKLLQKRIKFNEHLIKFYDHVDQEEGKEEKKKWKKIN